MWILKMRTYVCISLYWSSLVTVILCQPVGSKDNSQGEDDPWLVDFTQEYVYEMQADSAGPGLDNGRGLVCPPAPKRLITSGCRAAKCDTDARCGVDERCCFNGCIKTCVKAIRPPPVVDWIREPPRRLTSGLSWLVSGPLSESQAEGCSTNDVIEADEDPLLCPHGFICNIEDLGDPSRGIPNRGHCIRERTPDEGMPNTGLFRIQENTDEGRRICIFENTVLVDGTHFLYGRHPCECHEGSITCRVGDR